MDAEHVEVDRCRARKFWIKCDVRRLMQYSHHHTSLACEIASLSSPLSCPDGETGGETVSGMGSGREQKFEGRSERVSE